MPEVRSRRPVDRCNVVAFGDNFEHPHCRFRQTIALPSLRQSKCAGNEKAHLSTAKGLLMCGRFTAKATLVVADAVSNAGCHAPREIAAF